MNVTVTKTPDGVLYMTKDSHGELFAGDVKPGAKPVKIVDDSTLELVAGPVVDGEDPVVLARFSYVDYLDTANRDVPGEGVRQRFERQVPGRFDCGPYMIDVVDA